MPVTATASLHSPADAATGVAMLERVGLRWTPTNPGGNPLDGTYTATVDGVAYAPVTATAAGGGAFDVYALVPFKAGRLMSASFTARTSDANVNTEVWSFTPRRPWGAVGIYASVLVAAVGAGIGLVDQIAIRANASQVLADQIATKTSGAGGHSTAIVDMNALAATTGVLGYTPAITDMLATVFETTPSALAVAAMIAEHGADPWPVALNIESTEQHDVLPVATAITATEEFAALLVAANISVQDYYTLLPIACLIGTHGADVWPVSAEIVEIKAKLVVQLNVISRALQIAEEN